MVAATYSNEAELPQSKRCFKSTMSPIRHMDRPEMELVDRLAKGMLPEDVEKKRQKSIESGYEPSNIHSYQ